MLSSVDDQMHRALNCKCKSEDAGPWRGHGLEREGARPLAPFCSEMFIFTRFLKGLATTTGRCYFACFPYVFDDFRWMGCQPQCKLLRLL